MPEQDETVALPPSSSHSGRSRYASSTPRSASRFEPGQVIAGRYRIIALLGKGGMGEVYRADDLMLEQSVALKFLPLGSPGERFRNEVKIARQVSHPNVCRVYDAGEIEGQLYLSMEYVDGEDLGSLLRRIGRLPADKALEISRKLCAGLSAAHEKGVLHRDLKPGNVMLDGRGQILLTDFGLAAIAGEVEGGEIRSGTPAYMAPEQLSGMEVTVRSDLYSLGLVMYELFTGKRPYESETLAGLMEVRSSSTPVSLTSIVRDVDPIVERVIQRCLDSDPARRPSSAIAIAAMLPGGDPLAAALAAGETPSPQMVAAAGEGRGLAARIAIPLMVLVIAGIIGNAVLMNHNSVLELTRPEYGPEVLKVKARDIVHRLGYTGTPADDAYGFYFDGGETDWIKNHEKPKVWREALAHRPSALRFWYRRALEPFTGTEFHDDLLSTGIVEPDDPAPVRSGMLTVMLDAQGRLQSFDAIPPQKEEQKGTPPAADWSLLFGAAGLEPGAFHEATPEWSFLSPSDERKAWTGVWPGTARSLRIEAAAWRGKPVGFLLASDWTTPDRMPSTKDSGVDTSLVFSISIVLLTLGGGAVFARRNMLVGKGDRRGAVRLAGFTFVVLMLVWAAKVHLVFSLGLLGMFLITIATALGWSVVMWMIYMAVEPFVRRYWPQSIISWSSVMVGNWRDPVVGRDVLAGIGLGTGWRLLDRAFDSLLPVTPGTLHEYVLSGLRATIGGLMTRVQYGVRTALLIFFIIFLLRVLLRKQWLAGAAFVLAFSLTAAAGHHEDYWVQLADNAVVDAIIAIAVVRLGLLSLAFAFFTANATYATSALQPTAWYFSNVLFALAVLCGLAAWGCWMSMDKKEWRSEIFG